METPGGRGDSRFNLGYNMNLLSGETPPDIYSNPNISLTRPSTSLQQLSPRHTMVTTACGGPGRGGGLKTTSADSCFDERGMPSHQSLSLDACGVSEISEDTYGSIQPRKSPPSNGKKTKGRVKIKMEYIENKLRRYTTFSKRKTGIMKKAYELSTLTGTQVMLLVASETGHVYTFATRKLQPMITSEAGKALIQTCLNSPDPPGPTGPSDQRMSATGFEETELTYNISDDDSKEDGTSPFGNSSDSSEGEQDADSDDCQDSNNKDLIGGGKSLSNGVASNGDKASTTTGGGGQKLTVSPLVYQTPQGALYSAPGGGGVILSLAPPPGSEPGTAPQFITIPLPVAVQAAKQQQVAAAAHAQLQQQQQQQQQQQLDLSAKRK